jgi:hypothetical protein
MVEYNEADTQTVENIDEKTKFLKTDIYTTIMNVQKVNCASLT